MLHLSPFSAPACLLLLVDGAIAIWATEQCTEGKEPADIGKHSCGICIFVLETEFYDLYDSILRKQN